MAVKNMSNLRLTQLAKASGCAAKVGPGELGTLLGQLRQHKDPNLLVGFDLADDAAVYQLPDGPAQALVSTLDFFPPIVDDPYDFGQVAAANALSDVYAMGGRPLLALNILCFPLDSLPKEVALEILKGGLDKVHEAGALLAGGHSVNDDELKYGLAVTGLVDPARLLTNGGAKAGQLLILTKALGTGIMATAAKAELAEAEALAAALASMKQLNSLGAKAADFGITGGTDVTGFGLLGHAYEMANASNLRLTIEAKKVPLLPQVPQLAQMGLCPKGWLSNTRYIEKVLYFNETLPSTTKQILADPQSSGGLLLAVPEESAVDFLELAKYSGLGSAAIIGRVEAGPPSLVVV